MIMFPGFFSRTKKGGSYRMILNLKTFNELFEFKHCKLDSIQDALDLIIEGCYFGSINLIDASIASLFIKSTKNI